MKSWWAIVLAGASITVAAQNGAPSAPAQMQPRILLLPTEHMLVVEAPGDPNVVGNQAFGLLFQLYYSIGDVNRSAPPVPRARWPENLAVSKNSWLGLYALPLPRTVTNLPSFAPRPGLRAIVTNWDYGEVAEVVYHGPYSNEAPALKELQAFITKQGYVALGGHEEVYLRGPGMGGKNDPLAYVTLLRYRVKKAASTADR